MIVKILGLHISQKTTPYNPSFHRCHSELAETC